ncbi:MAG: hypothetical protein ACKO90_32805, partial [Microcystis panniformis]
LSSFKDTDAWDTSYISVSNGGTVLLGNIQNLDAVDITFDNDGTLDVSSLVTYKNSVVVVTGENPNFSNLTDVTGSNFTLTNTNLNFSHVTEMSSTAWTFNSGTIVDFSLANNLNYSNLNVQDGVQVSLPSVINY